MRQMLNTVIAFLVFGTGCATSPNDLAHRTGPITTCHVCEYNNDLACVRVQVKDGTPKAEYEGSAYYFCSEHCRAAFLKKPGKYLATSGKK